MLCWHGCWRTAVAGGIAAAQDRLDGTYLGIDDAEGARIRIAPDPGGFTGTFSDAQGNSRKFKADRVEDAAEAVMEMDGQTVLLRIAPLPFGAQVSIIPLRADGSMALEFSRALGFIREGVRLPEKPDAFVDAPLPGKPVAGNGFVESYQFWSPEGVVNGYLGLPDRFRTLLRMFPAVQLDVIWKLCLAPQADRALGIALRGQGVACPEVVDAIAQDAADEPLRRVQGRGRRRAPVAADLDPLRRRLCRQPGDMRCRRQAAGRGSGLAADRRQGPVKVPLRPRIVLE